MAIPVNITEGTGEEPDEIKFSTFNKLPLTML